jgi:hypothetical protein
VDGLREDALSWQPAEGVNHIGFLFWHIVRDEDTVICQSVLGRPQLWAREAWAARLGLPGEEQGTGLNSAELPRIQYNLSAFLPYAHKVFAQTDAALAGMDAARLAEDLAWSSEWRLANLLTTGCLSHGWVHLGEIRQLRGLRGWKFRE